MDFKSITVTKGTDSLEIHNPTKYPLVGKGAQGAVFKLTEDRCVKIYPKTSNAEREKKALKVAQHLPFIPKVFETGSNYIVMEFLNGPNLKEYLRQRRHLPEFITKQLLSILYGLKSLNLAMIDAPLRHIFVVKNEQLKMIDHVDAFEKDLFPIPVKLFRELNSLRLLDDFLQQVKKINPDTYNQWEKYLTSIKNKFKKIIGKHGMEKIRLDNAILFALLGKKYQNAVFRLSQERCIKIFGENRVAALEQEALKYLQDIPFIPKVYRTGSNFIVMETLIGPSLYTYLKRQSHLSEDITRKLVEMLKIMEKTSFTKIDAPLHNIIITGNGFKLFDHADSFTIYQEKPLDLLEDLQKLNFLDSFLEQVRKIDPKIYSTWTK